MNLLMNALLEHVYLNKLIVNITITALLLTLCVFFGHRRVYDILQGLLLSHYIMRKPLHLQL